VAIEVQINLDNLIGKIRGINTVLFSTAGMKTIGQRVQALNEDQITKQIDSSGHRVKPYHPLYAKAKGENRVTYVSKKLQSASDDPSGAYERLVEESSTGHMMSSFRPIRVRASSVEVGFGTAKAKQKAVWNYQRSGQPLRKFIGLTRPNKNKLFKFINKRIDFYS
jgi:hypothetical protein